MDITRVVALVILYAAHWGESTLTLVNKPDEAPS